MTRERSWAAAGATLATLATLRRTAARGYVVSVFRLPCSLLGSIPAAVFIRVDGGRRQRKKIRYTSKGITSAMSVPAMAPPSG